MAARGGAFTITYMAWDFPNQAGAASDSANHTLKILNDGVERVPTNNPMEIDPIGIPGMYKLDVTAAETQCSILVVCGVSSTVGVSITPFEMSLT